MKTIYFLIICTFLVFPAFAQVTGGHTANHDSTAGTKAQAFSTQKKFNNLSFYQRTHISVETGASYSAFGKVNIFSTWIAPEINYALTPRLYVSAGALVLHNNLNNFGGSINNENMNSGKNGSTQYYLFVSGAYLLNDHITITAATLQGLPNRSIGLSSLSYNSIGMNVKFSDHFSISAACVFSKGTNSWGMPVNNPFNHPAFPLNNNMFNW